MFERINSRRRPRAGGASGPEAGFTLIELLVVITILGILSGVVVFAVSGIRDKGKGSAVKIDERTIRTAEETYCAQNRKYATAQELVDAKLLSDLPTYNAVYPSQGGGNCNGWKFSMLRTAQADPYPPGKWDRILPPDLFAQSMVRLPDGRVFVQGFDLSDRPAAFTWDPSTPAPAWIPQDPPPYFGFPTGNTAILLDEDPTTPYSECSGAVDNCGKVLLFGKYLFNPAVNVGSGQWETIPSGGPGCLICNNGDNNFAYVQIKGAPSLCGANCGKIAIFAYTGNCDTACGVFDVYDPKSNTYVSSPYGETTGVRQANFSSGAYQIPDGRVLGCCVGGASFLDPASLSFTEGAAVPPRGLSRAVSPQPGPVLPDGSFLFGNGQDGGAVYTPQDGGGGAWREVPKCEPTSTRSRRCNVLGALSDGRVLAILSVDSGDPFSNTNQTYAYNPAASAWSRLADLNSSESVTNQGLLLDPADGPCGSYCGKVIVLGYQSAEVYTP